MIISELIKELNYYKDLYGDLPVAITCNDLGLLNNILEIKPDIYSVYIHEDGKYSYGNRKDVDCLSLNSWEQSIDSYGQLV